jgi:RNA polymerase sigma-70 factor (ECF subfamily)
MSASAGVISASVSEEEAAAVRAAAKEPAAFAEIYRRYVDDVYRYLLVKSASAEDAEDLVAETFLAALRAASGYRGTGVVKAWLIGIARRKAVDAHRARRPSLPLESAEAMPDPRRTEELSLQRDELARVAFAMRALLPDRAEALRLRYFAGLECGEIAPLMKRSEAAVKMLVHRGLRELREKLEEEER